MKYYKGVVLLESLVDSSILGTVEIANIRYKDELTATNEQPNRWSWYSVKVSEESLNQYLKDISQALKPRAWYTNLWKDGDYILIFPNKIFRKKTMQESEWEDAIKYGLSIGIPLEQLQPLDDILQTE